MILPKGGRARCCLCPPLLSSVLRIVDFTCKQSYVFLFSDNNSPSIGAFWPGHGDPAPGPIDPRSLPLAGRLRFLRLSDKSVQVGGLAAALPVAGLSLHPSQPDQVIVSLTMNRERTRSSAIVPITYQCQLSPSPLARSWRHIHTALARRFCLR